MDFLRGFRDNASRGGFALALANYLGGTASTLIRVFALILNLAIAGVFVFMGVFARRKHRWAFIVGRVLYVVDSLVLLWAQDYISFAFHIFVFFMLRVGLQARDKLAKLEQANPMTAYR